MPPRRSSQSGRSPLDSCADAPVASADASTADASPTLRPAMTSPSLTGRREEGVASSKKEQCYQKRTNPPPPDSLLPIPSLSSRPPEHQRRIDPPEREVVRHDMLRVDAPAFAADVIEA